MNVEQATGWNAQTIVGAASMGLLGLGFIATALVIVWPDGGVGAQPAAALGVDPDQVETTATTGPVTAPTLPVAPVVTIPDGGAVYCHPKLDTCVHLSTEVKEVQTNE